MGGYTAEHSVLRIPAVYLIEREHFCNGGQERFPLVSPFISDLNFAPAVLYLCAEFCGA